MNQLSRSAQKSTWDLFLSLGYLPRVFGSGARRFVGAASIYLVEYRQARSAEELYHRLSRMSDEELAKRGLHRGDIVDFVKKRLS